jgi:hypothetical protein
MLGIGKAVVRLTHRRSACTLPPASAYFGGAITAHCDCGQQPYAPVVTLLHGTLPVGQHFPLRQPVPLAQHTFPTPTASGAHTY